MSPLFPKIQSELDLNGPTLSFSTQPVDIVVPASGIVTFTGIATAVFPVSQTERKTNTGTVTHQWHAGTTALTDGENQFVDDINLSFGRFTITRGSEPSVVVDATQISSYDNFVTGEIYTIVADSNIEVDLFAFGADGSSDARSGGISGRGGTAKGRFTFIANQTYKLIIGKVGTSDYFPSLAEGAGGRSNGGSKSGGGFSGLFINSVTQANSIIIAGGGGAGADDSANYRPGGHGGFLNADGNKAPWSLVNGGSQTEGGLGFYDTRDGSGIYGSLYTYMTGSAFFGGYSDGNATSRNGGGAGGGYFGGGAGRSDSNYNPGPYGSGGGSSFLHPTLLTNGEAAGGTSALDNANNSRVAGEGGFRIQIVSVEAVTGLTITGSATTTLTLSGLTSPLPISNQIFVQAGYIPNNLTPNAINEPLNSNKATLTVSPTISIDTQPQDTTVVENVETTLSISASVSDNSAGLGYKWYLNGSTISGANSATLSITRPNSGLDKVYCEVSHPTAQPGIVTSREANLEVVSPRSLIIYEKIGSGTVQERGERNLGSEPFTARARENIDSRMIQIFSPEKDIVVKITMGGSAGGTQFRPAPGEGGISVFKMTLKKNVEYTVKLGVNTYQGGGPRGGIPGGGGLAVIYEKARVLAVCGGGGGAGSGGRGGDGGGCNVAGERGQNGSNGGSHVGVDELPSTGMTQAGRTGFRDFDNESSGSGRLSGCTIGNYWNRQGKSPCEDVGTGVALLNGDGQVLSNTTRTSTGPITRGYKSGQGHRNNAGRGTGSGNGGGGGAGARGGEGTGGNSTATGGGGGGSGYYSSQVELLSSSTLPNGTQLGGNAGAAFISIEAYSINDDQEPLIAPIN